MCPFLTNLVVVLSGQRCIIKTIIKTVAGTRVKRFQPGCVGICFSHGEGHSCTFLRLNLLPQRETFGRYPTLSVVFISRMRFAICAR